MRHRNLLKSLICVSATRIGVRGGLVSVLPSEYKILKDNVGIQPCSNLCFFTDLLYTQLHDFMLSFFNYMHINVVLF